MSIARSTIAGSALTGFLLVIALGCATDPTDVGVADGSATSSTATTETPSSPSTGAEEAATSLPPTSDEILEALTLATMVVPPRLGSLVAVGDELWATGDGSVVRLVDGRVEEVTIEGVEEHLLPNVVDGGIWLSERGGSVVVPIDTETFEPGTAYDIGPPVGKVISGPDGRLWVEATQPPAGLRPFDPVTGEAGDVVVLAPSDEVVGSAVVGDSIWAPVFGANELVRLDADLNIVGSVPTGVGPATIRAVGDTIWWANRTDGTLGRLDTRTGEMATIALDVAGPILDPGPIETSSSDMWTLAATIPDRTGVVIRIDPATDEAVAVRTLPGRRSIDEVGGMATLGDRLFVLFSTTGEVVELDVDDFTAVPAADRPTPTVAAMSQDEIDVRDLMSIVFSSSTPDADALALMEGDDDLAAAFGGFRDFFAENFPGEEVGVRVDGVRIDGDTGEVDYAVTVSGGPVVDIQTATISRTDDGWRLGQSSFCALVAEGGVACP